MYNRFLEYLLDYNPQKVLSKKGVTIRKIISPVLRFIVPFVAPNSKLKIVRRSAIPKKPVIFAATHGFREDAEYTVVMAGRHAYVLNGSLKTVFNSFAGIASWLNGMILVNREDKQSRNAAKEKMIYALKLGTSIIMYPEGTWNKSPNELVIGLFPGVYDVAKASGALVVPIATCRKGNKTYGIREEAFDICRYSREEGIKILRDKMATMQYEMIERFDKCKRSLLPYGIEANEYWQSYIDSLVNEAKFYEHELEKHAKYREKGVTNKTEAFAFMEKLRPNAKNAFLYRK